MWLLVGSALIALLVWMIPTEGPDEAAEDASAAEPRRADRARASRRRFPCGATPRPWQVLKVGMTDDKVLAIQGEPLSRDEKRWDYGPSWIEFDEGKVIAWYSSPLRPLKFATPRPPPLETIEP